MYLKNYILLPFLIVTFFYGNSQNFDFGKVSKAELQETYNPKDSSASATILYRKEVINFTYNGIKRIQKKEIHIRLKVYNSDGFDWATDKVYLFNDDYREEKIKDLEGSTYFLVNGNIEKIDLTKEGIFEEKKSENLKSISFTFPNVKQGSIVEYRYTILSPYLGVDDIQLQFTIPVKRLIFYISTPKNIKYNKILNPRSSYQPTVIFPNYSEEKGLQVNYDRVVSILEDNIPALKEEPFSGNINNYRAKMSFELAGTLTQYGGISDDFSASWEKISKKLAESKRFGEQCKKKTFYKKDLNTLLEGVEKESKLISLVENFVKSKIKWNGNYGKYTQKGIRDAYIKGEGNVSDINLLVVSILRSRGLNANPVVISTKNNGVPLFPTEDGLNYVICMVEYNGNQIFIDATEELAPNGLLPERVLNWQGLLVLEDKSFKWVDLKPNNQTIESTTLNITINKDLSIKGKVRKNLTSYRAFNYRKEFSGLGKDKHIKSLELNKGDVQISELDFQNEKDVSKPVKLIYNYELFDSVDEIGDKLYLTPLLFFTMKENLFKLEERKYPIDFVIPYKDKYIVNIMLPEGYTTESLPQSEAIAFKDNDAVFKYILKQNGNYLQLKVELNINQPFVQPSDYKDFKAFFSKIVEKQTEQVVLTKA